MPVSNQMPTAARLMGAIFLAALGWIGSDMIRQLMPAETNFGWFNWVNFALGAVFGWRVVGRRAGCGYGNAINAGLAGVLSLVFWALLAQSLYEMLRQSLARKYDGPVEALIDVGHIAFQFGHHLLNTPLIMTLAIGGIAIGIVVEMIVRRIS